MVEKNESRDTKQQKQPGFRPGHGFGMPVQKPKDFKGSVGRLLTYMKPQIPILIVVFLMAVFSTAFAIKSPEVMGRATTKLFEGLMMKMKGVPRANIDYDYIFQVLVMLFGLYVFSAILSFVQQFLMAGVAQKTVRLLRKELSHKLSKLPLRYFDQRTHGETLSRVVNDIDNISNTLQQSVTQFITSFVTIIGIIYMMIKISPLMTLVIFVTLPLSIFFTKNIAKKSQQYFKKQQSTLGELNGHVEEMYTGHAIVKAFGYEKKSLEEFQNMNEALYEVGWKAQFVSGIIMPLMNFVNNIGYVLVSVIGGILVTRGGITIGNVQAIIQYARQFGQPIVQVANIANLIQSTVASAERVFEVLDEEEEPILKEEKVTALKSGDVEFKNVHFSYIENKSIIEDLSIQVRHGQTVAIVGPTGAGKTTLVNLLMRFYDVGKGKITLDGNNILHLERGNLRRQFGMVLQDTWLFQGTIYDNIAYGKEDATKAEVYHAAKLAQADHFIRTLPQGYDTILSEDANNISQGQRQLLTIARAILADPKIMILDEATSSVDTRTERQIQEAMIQLMKGRTNFVIAHRLSTIRDADMILVMDQGKILEIGNHNKLMEKEGFYYELYQSQFTGKSMKAAM